MGQDAKDSTRAGVKEGKTLGARKNLRVGTSGWSYDDWAGPFYPKTLPKELYLSFYAQVFDTCEIDSSFYHIPAEASARKWALETPPDFTFTAKIPKVITHEAMLGVGGRAEPVRPAGGLQVDLGRWSFVYAGDLHPDLGASHHAGLQVLLTP